MRREFSLGSNRPLFSSLVLRNPTFLPSSLFFNRGHRGLTVVTAVVLVYNFFCSSTIFFAVGKSLV